MRLIYWNSASITIETPDARILCDPWFGWPGANNWDGSWSASPFLPPAEDILRALGPHEYIYVSHVHDDHYCPEFLRDYLASYAGARLIVSDEPHLNAALARDGLSRLIASTPDDGRIGETEYRVVRCRPPGMLAPIDSALAVRCGEQAMVAMNDCPYDAGQLFDVRRFVEGRRVLACLPYLGAGEFPQTYVFDTEVEQKAAADRKRRQFLDLYTRYLIAFRPFAAVPYAGEYWLRGSLASLNALRGLPDALEAVHLEGVTPRNAAAFTFGGTWDLDSDLRTGTRTVPLDQAMIQAAIEALPLRPYRYARELPIEPARASRSIPGLLRAAAQRLRHRAPRADPYWYAIGPLGSSAWWGTVDLGSGEMTDEDVATLRPREEVRLHPCHAVLLLSGLALWNIALGGSHLSARRVGPYRGDVYELLNWLHA